MDISGCISYNFNWTDFILPSREIFQKVCIGYDKTYLFITTSIRMILFMIIAFAFKNYFVINGLNNKNIETHIFYVLLLYSLTNIVFLIIILNKEQAEQKKLII